MTVVLSNLQKVHVHTFKITLEHDCTKKTATLSEGAFNPEVVEYDLLKDTEK